MRGINQALARLSGVRAFIAGAAILSGASATQALGQGAPGQGDPTTGAPDETAMALPRLAPQGGGAGLALPQPLSPSDAARVRRIFRLQGRGDLPEAERETAQLLDPMLLGAILADRYLGRFHESAPAELADWLGRFADQPDASAIHDLLLKRLPAGAPRPPAPDEASPTQAAVPLAGLLLAGLRDASAARELFVRNRDTEALAAAAASARRGTPDAQAGMAAYVAGLAAWRLGRIEAAQAWFEQAAEAPPASADLRAAAAFWAGRARLRGGDYGGFQQWSARAASYPDTFYGMLAGRTLGALSQGAMLGEADLDAIAGTPAGQRALALIQVGERRRAAAELRALWRRGVALRRPVQLLARFAGLGEVAVPEPALLPQEQMPPLKPSGGFTVDPPLVYALVRVESNFNAMVVSRTGARGLMQLMPLTARFLAGEAGEAGGAAALRLHDPAQNLKLGQRYVTYLADQDAIGGDLIRTLASYNAGGGSFARWGSAIVHHGDPLLFIEAIPRIQTRAFVQEVLVRAWVYAARLGMAPPGLDAIAAGRFPRLSAPPVIH